MNILNGFKNNIFQCTLHNFDQLAINLFYFQAQNNEIYRKYIRLLKRDPNTISRIQDIPFMPIDFFKDHIVKTSSWEHQCIYESSGTVSQITSKHYIEDKSFYLKAATLAFETEYGPLENFHILALLPSYLERGNSSLVVMVSFFIEKTQSTYSGFYLDNYDELFVKVEELKDSNRKILLIGVSFAVLGFAEAYEGDLKHIILMETGGMKGRREEMVRDQVHEILKNRFGLESIHSEYGMTELLSQSYSKGRGRFKTPPWMKVMVRDLNDPFSLAGTGKNGGINIIDLANVHSCAFIETKDIGLVHEDNSFEVLGRFDNSDLRGCNLLVT